MIQTIWIFLLGNIQLPQVFYGHILESFLFFFAGPTLKLGCSTKLKKSPCLRCYDLPMLMLIRKISKYPSFDWWNDSFMVHVPLLWWVQKSKGQPPGMHLKTLWIYEHINYINWFSRRISEPSTVPGQIKKEHVTTSHSFFLETFGKFPKFTRYLFGVAT